MGNVWRADRPQRGRFRQFMQCDIDILGEASNLAEIELILATTTLLGKLDFRNFTIRINDRRILKAAAAYCGFPEEAWDEVFIVLDKMDKIGLDGVAEELEKEGFPKEAVEKCRELFLTVTPDIDGVRFVKEKLDGFLDPACADGLMTIMNSVDAVKTADFKIAFDLTLVRGMSYYTGPIFEISMDEYGGSVGGGGRYDGMVGKFTGQSTPACGFSIGFERIVMLLLERNFQIPDAAVRKAYLLEKKLPDEKIRQVISQGHGRARTWDGSQSSGHEEKQKVPEGTAGSRGLHGDRRRICPLSKRLRRQKISQDYQNKEKQEETGMAESMKGMKRSHRCGEVTEQEIGKEVTLMGWVQKSRNKGGIIFVDLRDRSGIMQLIFENGTIDDAGFEKGGETPLGICDCRQRNRGTPGRRRK
jgi:histidyl-tRNA synthetase